MRISVATGVLLLFALSFSLVSRGAATAAEIVVTTAADVSNGDVSSVAALKADPGPDGISLREAIEATDNDPGSYDIRFDPSLSGSTIAVGATCCGSLPPLMGGNVSIDGDVNGDGRPDVTLAAGSSEAATYGIDVVSSNNRLQGLALRGFDNGVLFTAASEGGALPTGKTFAGNVVSGLTITGSSSAIRLQPTGPDPGHPECADSACPTHNRWTDTEFVDNTIDMTASDRLDAIDVALEGVAGDTVDSLTIDGNTIRLVQSLHAIDFFAGSGAHADSNVISKVVVSHNTIDASIPAAGIDTWSGFRGGSNNLVEDFKILDNVFHFSGTPTPGAEGLGIAFAVSDAPSSNGVIPADNAAQSLQIVGNTIDGPATAGIAVSDPCCGDETGSRLSNVGISANTIDTTLPSADSSPFGIEIGGRAPVSKVVLSSNTIVQQAPGPASDYAAYLAGGGIVVLGGSGKAKGSIRNVVVTRNRVDTPLAGITIVGGAPSDEDPAPDVTGNQVSGIHLSQNRIVRAPVLATRWNRRIKGISVIGGLSWPRPSGGHWPHSTQNSVECISLKGNVVVGRRDGVSVFANLGPQASSNTARLGRC